MDDRERDELYASVTYGADVAAGSDDPKVRCGVAVRI
jgi:hypothetical protein